MSVTEKKRRFEAGTASLVGNLIARVRYASLDYFDDLPHWDYGELHSPDMGVELTLSNGDMVNLGWGREFCQYGLAVSVGRDEPLWSPEAVMWDVSDESHWAAVRDQPITSALQYWYHSLDDDAAADEYPQDLELVFGSCGTAWILAAEFDVGSRRLSGAADELVVTFDENVIRRNGFAAYARRDWLRRVVRA